MTISCSRLTAVLLLAIALAGCQGDKGETPEPQTAEERAQARWDLIVERDFVSAWALHTPGFRETSTAEQYASMMGSRPVRWTAAEVVGSACDGDRCQVLVDVTYNVPSAPNGLSSVSPTSQVEETWIRTQGKWWYVQEN